MSPPLIAGATAGVTGIFERGSAGRKLPGSTTIMRRRGASGSCSMLIGLGGVSSLPTGLKRRTCGISAHSLNRLLLILCARTETVRPDRNQHQTGITVEIVAPALADSLQSHSAWHPTSG